MPHARSALNRSRLFAPFSDEASTGLSALGSIDHPAPAFPELRLTSAAILSTLGNLLIEIGERSPA
ncbi:MAG: hypothetical protein AB1704_20785 [Pseudomonadota bacterium]